MTRTVIYTLGTREPYNRVIVPTALWKLPTVVPVFNKSFRLRDKVADVLVKQEGLELVTYDEIPIPRDGEFYLLGISTAESHYTSEGTRVIDKAKLVGIYLKKSLDN